MTDPPETPDEPQDPKALERLKAAALRRFFGDDPWRERDMEAHERRSGAPPESPPEETVEAPRRPEPPRSPPQHREQRGRHREPHRDRPRERERPRGPAPESGEVGALRRERDQLRSRLASMEGRCQSLHREAETLRNRLRSLAGEPRAAAAPAPPPPAPPPRPAGGGPPSPALAGQRVGLFVEFRSFLENARRRGRRIEVGRLLATLLRGRPLVRAIGYGAPAEGGELATALRAAGFEAVAADDAATAVIGDLDRLAGRLDAMVIVGFDDRLEPSLRRLREAGVRVEVAGFAPHDSPRLAAEAHAFTRLGEEGPP